MKRIWRPARPNRRSLRPVAWLALPVIGLAVGVLASGLGVDVLMVAVAGMVLLLLERTVGDWLADTTGPVPATIVFAAIVAGFTWFVVGSADEFFAAAEERGFRRIYYQPARAYQPERAAAPVDRRFPLSSGQRASGQQANRTGRVSAARDASAAPMEVGGAPERQTASNAAPSTATAVASRTLFGAPKERAPLVPTRIAVKVEPAQVSPARRVVFEAVVHAGDRPVASGSVRFIVNGAAVAMAAVDSRGVATSTFATYFPGTHEVRASYSGTTEYEPSASRVHTWRVTQR
jgi:hypothetical protein